MKFLQEYFVLSSSERRGVFLFSLLLFLMILGYIIIPYLIKPQVPDQREFLALMAKLDEQPNNILYSSSNMSLYTFNPNQIGKEELINMGVQSKIANTLINYREKVSSFYVKEDLLKVYGIDQDLYSKLEPYILLSEENDEASKHKEDEVSKSLTPFEFNPNTISLDEMIKLGLTKKQAEQLANYRNKGGKFRKKEDLKKLYSITEEEYFALEPFILLENSTPEIKLDQEFQLDINTATIEDFKRIKGIGEKRSDAIIKYREKLGGFVRVGQLKEVYGMDQEVIEKNLDKLLVKVNNVKKLNINTLDIKELSAHPYLSYNEAQIIVNYRKVHGLFTHVNEIKTNNLVKEEVYSKIAPYLEIE